VPGEPGPQVLGPVADYAENIRPRFGCARSPSTPRACFYTTRAALPHLLQAAKNGPRRVADIVNISSIAGRVAWTGYGVYNFTKFGVNGFTESLRQEVTQRHVRIGVVEPGGVATELGSHNKPAIRNEMIRPARRSPHTRRPELRAREVQASLRRRAESGASPQLPAP